MLYPFICCALSRYMETNYASIPTGVRPYAGLSFKSGYQQTGYVHPILSYYDVKYYYCLELGAWSLELAAWACGCAVLTVCSMRTTRDLIQVIGQITIHKFGQALGKPSFFNVLISPITSYQKTCGTTSLFLPT